MSDAKKMLKELSYTHLVPKDSAGKDMVEVVRCTACKYERSCAVAMWLGGNGYCSKGERKDDD